MLTEAKLRRICFQADTGTLLLQDLPKTYQWADILRTTVKHLANPHQIMGLQFCPGALFTGSEGNGRHSHANALANNLVKLGGYTMVMGIHGSDLDFEDSDDIYSVLDYLEKLVVCSEHTVLILDQPELSQHNLRFQNQLLRLQQSLQREKKTLFLIVITKSTEDIVSGLLSAFPRYHCPKPSNNAVSAFVDDMLKKPVPIKIPKVTKTEIIKALKNCSWKQLTDLHTQLHRMIVFHYLLNYKSYRSKGYTEEQVYQEGHVQLSAEAVKAVLASIADQNPLPVMPVVQTVASAGSIQPTSAPKMFSAETDDDLATDDAIRSTITEAADPVEAFCELYVRYP